MKIIKPSVELLWITPNAEKIIELAGRTCYKSENLITEESSSKFIQNIIKREHGAVLEHASASLRFICDRGVTHELVRHRLVAYCQESTRFCNYSKDKFNHELTFIEPCFWNETESNGELVDIDFEKRKEWIGILSLIEQYYFRLIELGATAQEARSVLPNSLKTEIVATANLREWRHILKLRTSPTAHPQICEIMLLAKKILKKECPNVFGDIE
jgi:thymidylate synthase (FAD)